MKVCIINSLYRPYMRGGAETVTENILLGLKEAEHKSFLITLGKKNEKIELEGVQIYKIKPFNLFSFIDISKSHFFLRIFWHGIDMLNFDSRRKIKKILQKEKPDVVLSHNLKGIGYLIPKLIKKMKIQHVHTLHDVQLLRPSGLLLYGQEKPFLILDKIYERLCRHLFGSPDIVISPSSWLMDMYVKRGFFYRSKRRIVRNPIGEYETRNIEKNGRKNIADSKVSFLYVGQLEPSKGIVFLLETLKHLDRKDWELRIAGSGSLEEEIKKTVSDDDRFKFYGFIKRSRLSNVFFQSDCTIIPSLCYENSPTVIYESFAAGVPVIASDIGGIPELVKDQINGFTFEPGDKDNLTKVLCFYLDHPQIIEQLKKNTKSSIKNFSAKKYLQEVFSLLV